MPRRRIHRVFQQNRVLCLTPAPRLPYKAIETILAQTGEKIPKAREMKAEDFIDPTSYNELEKSGFFKTIGR